MDIKNFASAINEIAEEKGISVEKVFETIEQAIAAAYKKDYGKRGQIIQAKLDIKTNKLLFWQIKKVVEESMIYSEEELEKMQDEEVHRAEESEEDRKIRFNQEKHIMFEDAQKIQKGIEVGEDLKITLEAREDYGRIAAQTAKQVIMQKLREAERESIFTEYKDRKGEIISGIIQRIENNNVFVDIGKTLGILIREEQVPGEFYRPNQRLKFFVMKVEDTTKGAKVFLSRSYPKLITKLFELEVPEIADNQVEIKSIAREAGSRTKIAVASSVEGIDPIGAAVGQRGTRVQAVINELGGEKIDIVEWSDDPEKFIANALSPAKVLEVKVLPKNKVVCIVPEDQLSLAIGKDGQNVRLAAKLTGWKIDVKSPEDDNIKEVDEEASKEEEVALEEKPVKKEKKKKKPKKETKKTKTKTKKEK